MNYEYANLVTDLIESSAYDNDCFEILKNVVCMPDRNLDDIDRFFYYDILV